MKKLEFGESATLKIDAGNPWNESGIILEAGCQYDFFCQPDQTWRNGAAPINASGYKSNSKILRMLESFRRAPSENWLRLIGAVEKDARSAFSIGIALTAFVPSRTGALFCFANDLRCMYRRHRGTIIVTMTKTGSPRVHPIGRLSVPLGAPREA